MNTTLVLALLPLFVVVAHSFPWDIVVGREKRLEFFYNGTVTHTEDIPLADDIVSVTYDPVQFRVLLFVDHSPHMFIHSFDLTTKKMQTIVTRPTKLTIYLFKSLAYDPVTQLLFWNVEKEIYSLLLKPSSFNKVDLLVTLDHYYTVVAVDSCGGFIYWATKYNIERAAFDGSKREVLINYHVQYRASLAIDQQKQKMYWIDETTIHQFSIESADLSGKNRRTFYYIGYDTWAAALTVSKDFVYWRSYDQKAILQIPKHQEHGVAPVIYTQSSLTNCGVCQLTAANYTIEEQTLGIKSCEALKSLILDVEERNGSICYNYCFQGNFSVSAEGHPKCSCNRGYSGERCEVDACHKHCFNDGVCSLTEADKPVCQCTVDYHGERCDVSICKDYCLHGNCSVSTEGKRTCSCNHGYSGERCDVFFCKDYCFHGSCSVSIEGQPTCSCNRGYSGERCEVNACDKHCFNDGVCSLNEAEKPVCQCTADYQGERCEVSICMDYCMQGNCSITTEGQPTCRCTAGYTGERCEVNACHEHCLNNGDCSLNEEDEPFCQCTADYEGERCDITTTHHVDDMKQILRDLRSEMKQVIREELQCTLQLYSDKLDENAAKIQKCEEAMKYNLQNHDETTSKTQTSSRKF